MAVFLICWLWIPEVCMLLFLGISSYHFGQSQLVDLNFKHKLFEIISYMAWGCFIFSSLFYFGSNELEQLYERYPDFRLFSRILAAPLNGVLALISCLFIVTSLIWLRSKGLLKTKRLILELAVIAISAISFYHLSLIISFLLYFCIMHSTRVLLEEKAHLSQLGVAQHWKDFLKLLTPVTVLSLLGIFFIIWLSHIEVIACSPMYLLVIVTSMITLPHVIVMEGFYLTRSQPVTSVFETTRSGE
jgi:beta-carotene 15,15'-dioxygenase